MVGFRSGLVAYVTDVDLDSEFLLVSLLGRLFTEGIRPLTAPLRAHHLPALIVGLTGDFLQAKSPPYSPTGS